jgi:hypothetical protein
MIQPLCNHAGRTERCPKWTEPNCADLCDFARNPRRRCDNGNVAIVWMLDANEAKRLNHSCSEAYRPAAFRQDVRSTFRITIGTAKTGGGIGPGASLDPACAESRAVVATHPAPSKPMWQGQKLLQCHLLPQ